MFIGKAFDNIQSYNKAMSRAIDDKIYFLDHLPKEDKYLFVDFGCADGAIINELIDRNAGVKYIGYDISSTMIDIAKTNFSKDADVIFTTEWEEVQSNITNTNLTTVLILSSVIHEVYSYALSKEDINTFWSRVKDSNFDYIVIRDMMIRKSIIDRFINPDIETAVRKTCSDNADLNKMLSEFENKYGSIMYKKNCLHFLLKYRWKINWNRELNENYFPICVEDFLKIIKEPPYQMIYFKSFRVKFIDDCIFKDFGINSLSIEDTTHIKLIFKNV